MSVSFNTVPGPVVGFTLTCGHGPTRHRFVDYAAVREFLNTEAKAHGGTGHLAECGDEFCATMPVQSLALEADPSPSLRLSNGGAAAALLRLLGYPVDGYSFSGSDTAGNVLDRVLDAQAADPDSGPLADLRGIAEFSAARDRDVQWA
jgi:hypothetical protein